jgi:hypothetical protein
MSNYDGLFGSIGGGSFSGVGGSPDGLGGGPDGLGADDTEYSDTVDYSEFDETAEEMADPDIGPQRDFNVPRQSNAYEPGYSPQYPYGATAGPVQFIEPVDTSNTSASRSAGMTVLFVAAAAGIGYAVKGGLGAVSGLLLAGAAANTYRAQKWWKSEVPSEKHEAIVSAVFAGGGLLAGGYVGYKAMEKSR